MGFSRRYRFYFVLVALSVTGPALAASEAQCQREQAALNQWREGNERLEQHLEHLDTALSGEPVAPAALTDALGVAPTGAASPAARVPAAVVPGCDALAPEYNGVRERTLRLTEQRQAKRRAWFELPETQRRALSTWHELYQNLAGAPAEGGSDDYLRERLASLIALTPLLRRDPTAALTALDGLARRPGTPPWLSAAEPAQEMLWRRQSAEAQRQVLAVRASLWGQVGSLPVLAQRGGPGAAPTVIDLETALAVDRLYQAFQLAFQEGRLNGEMRRYLPLLSNALALLLGIALFAVLIHLSRRGKSALLSLHARVMEASGGRRHLPERRTGRPGRRTSPSRVGLADAALGIVPGGGSIARRRAAAQPHRAAPGAGAVRRRWAAAHAARRGLPGVLAEHSAVAARPTGGPVAG